MDFLSKAAGTTTDAQGRPEPDVSGDELCLLHQFLEFHRATFAWKIEGLADDQARRRVGASSLSLAGLASHLAWVEDHWFTHVVGEEPMPPPWAVVDWGATPDADFDFGEAQPLPVLTQLWQTSCGRSRAVMTDVVHDAGTTCLDFTYSVREGQEQVTLRWVLIHMIEEYARHNGHADLLREATDGQTGQ